MADADFSTLENIFRMMTPGDLFGVPKASLGTPGETTIAGIVQTLFNQQGGGAVTAGEMKQALGEQLQKITDTTLKDQFHEAIRFYSTEGSGIDPNVTWYTQVPKPDQSDNEPLGDFSRVLGHGTPLAERNKKIAVIQSNSTFITPSVRKAGISETFLNFIPSIVLSRCVPYLSAEFVFDRPVNANNKLAAPGLLRFLLGSQDTAGDTAKGFAEGSANALMINGNRIINNSQTTVEKTEHIIAGMEMFTSPQTLVNPQIPAAGSRYVPVLDPFRPFASIDGLTINVASTVGTFSYKKATLTLKVHDRSRLSEIADLIQPLIYTRTTIWLTYGWRHPPEPNNPYAKLINDNMLVREPYGIVNSSYSFDNVGQVTVTLELYTKGTRELRDLRLTGLSNSFEDIQRQIAELSADITTYRQQLNLDPPQGASKEIRYYQVLESGERGEFPDMKPADVQSAITSLRKSLTTSGGKLDQDAANKLIEALGKLYAPDGTNKKQAFNFKERLDRTVTSTVNELFNELAGGPDPFLRTTSRETVHQQEVQSSKVSPFVETSNVFLKVRQAPKTVAPGGPKFKKRLVSFGKIFTTFVGRGVVAIPGIDELQIFFYTFNERAGKAASQNIAEFPIDLSVLYEQFKDHINRNRSDHMTLDEFMKLVIQAQLGDVRGVGYGFFAAFEPYDPKNPDAALKKNKQEEFENAYNGKGNKLGPFKKPEIEVYVESTYATAAGNKTDLLTSFEQAARLDSGRRADQYVRVMRIHVYDRQVDPYPMASTLLSADNSSPERARLVLSEILSSQYVDLATKGVNNLPPSVAKLLRQDPNLGVVPQDLVSNDKIKKFVSKFVPTIVYGGNASTVISANIASKNDPLVTTANMLGNKSGRPSVTQPNGGGTGGLPLRIIPAAINVTTLGCPTLDFMQLFFLDFNTGTTIDNKYGITGLTHTINAGKFETSITFSWFDAYGAYENPATFLQLISKLQVPQ